MSDVRSQRKKPALPAHSEWEKIEFPIFYATNLWLSCVAQSVDQLPSLGRPQGTPSSGGWGKEV